MDDLRRVHRAGLAASGRVLFWNDAVILSPALSRDGRLLTCGDTAGRGRRSALLAAGLRRHIVQAPAAALQDPGSRQSVWVSAEEADGTLDQALYRALLWVAGF